jgi:two-component system invasion response regulator UvrY
LTDNRRGTASTDIEGDIDPTDLCRARRLFDTINQGVYLVRILIADSRSKVRFALRALLEDDAEFHVSGEAANAGDLLVRAESSQPDVVLVDWELKGAVPEELLASLREACPDARIVVLSTRPEAGRAAIEAGADAFVSKAAPPDMLLQACRRVAALRNTHEFG